MRLPIDLHMHTSHSGDSTAPMGDMIAQARQQGLTHICFTEHMDLDYPVSEDVPPDCFTLDIPSYRKEYDQLSPSAPLWVGYGIELGLQPHLADRYREIIASHPFDFIIGSSHLLEGEDPYYPYFWENKDEEASYRRYFTQVTENLRAFHDFDIYGHIDYIVRYGPSRDSNYCYDRYKDVLDPIIDLLLEYNIGIEINTGGLRSGLKYPHPYPDLLDRYIQSGGRLITVGSDAHKPEQIAYGYEQAFRYLEEHGVRQVAVFQNRQPHFIRI